MRSGTALSPSASKKKTSGTPKFAMGHATSRALHTISDAFTSLNPSLDAFKTIKNAAYYRMCFSENVKTSLRTFIPEEKRCSFNSIRDTILNSWRHPLRPETTNQVEEAFSPGTSSVAVPRLQKQRYPWHFQAIQRRKHRLFTTRKTKWVGPVGSLKKFTARHFVVNEMVGTVGGNARTCNLYCTKSSGNSVTCVCSPIVGIWGP